MRTIRLTFGLGLFLAFLGTPTSTVGQSVEGTLRFPDESAKPVVVTALDAEQGVLARTITRSDGSFELDASSTARFVRLERVGYQTLTLPFREGSAISTEAPSRPRDLRPLPVAEALRCELWPSGEGRLAVAWSQAMTALRITDRSQTSDEILHDAVVHTRRLGPDGRRVVFEPFPQMEEGASRLTTTMDPAFLVQSGFMVEEENDDGYRFFSPDPAVLTSTAFLDTHCWRLREDGGPALVGVAFSPLPEQDRPEVAGVLWLEAASSRLVAMEFGYRNLDLGVDLSRVGGETVFVELPDGAWVTPESWLRLPILEVRRDPTQDIWGLAGLQEEGVRVHRVHYSGQSWSLTPTAARFTGTILDPTGALPLVGARVRLRGTDYETTTDEFGRFEMDGLLDGQYGVAFAHASVTDIDVGMNRVDVVLQRGQTASLELRAPSPDAVAVGLCQGLDENRDAVILTGQVRDSLTQEPLVGVPLSIRFRDPRRQGADHEARISTGGGGQYVYCDAPRGQSIRVKVLTPGHSERDTTVMATGLSVRTNLVIPFATVSGPGGVFGVVRDWTTGRPIGAVEVSIRDTGLSALSTPRGFFSFQEVPSGLHILEFGHVAYQDRELVVRLNGGQAYQVEIDLTVDPIPIEGITVSVVPRRLFADMVDLQHRIELGFGEFITRREIERRGGSLANLLQSVGGVEIVREAGSGSQISDQFVVLRSAKRFSFVNRDIGTDDAGDFNERNFFVERCYPAIYVDGHRFSKPRQGGIGHDPVDVSLFLSIELEAVEVYKGAGSVPAEFGGGDAACGSIVLWTRRSLPVSYGGGS